MGRDETSPDDAGLVAYLDGALEPEERTATEQRLADDPALRARLDEMARGSRPFREAFDAVAAAAPRERLDAVLAQALQARPVPAARPAAAPRPWYAARSAAIAAGLALFVLGAGAGHFAPADWWPQAETTAGAEGDPEAWRNAVADYVGLITSQTLLALPRDQAAIHNDLAVVGKKVGLDLSPGRLALPSLSLMRVDLFQFQNKPLVQIAYFDPENGPIAFCILGRKLPPEEPESERRRGMNISYWSTGNNAFMLVGRAPEEILAKLAARLSQQVS